MDGWLRMFSGDDVTSLAGEESSNTGTDESTNILAVIGIYGILQAYMAFEAYKAFVVEFD